MDDDVLRWLEMRLHVMYVLHVVGEKYSYPSVSGSSVLVIYLFMKHLNAHLAYARNSTAIHGQSHCGSTPHDVQSDLNHFIIHCPKQAVISTDAKSS